MPATRFRFCICSLAGLVPKAPLNTAPLFYNLTSSAEIPLYPPFRHYSSHFG